jgi:hypothetical protein
MSLAKPTAEEEALARDWAVGEPFAPGPGARPDIDAEVIRRLLTGAPLPWLTPPGPIPPGPVRMSGVRVTGRLDLRAVKARVCGGTIPQFEAIDCTFVEPIDLNFAAIDGLWLIGCDLPALSLRDARIDGRLDLGGCVISGAADEDGQPFAILGDGARVTGDVCLGVKAGRRFSAGAEVGFSGARIGGQLSASGADLENPDGFALDAEGAVIEGGMFLSEDEEDGHRFEARGGVNLLGARAASLLASGAKLTAAPGRTAALQGDGAMIAGEVQLVSSDAWRFEAFGETRFVGATLGELDCAGARLVSSASNERGKVVAALLCDRATVGGSVALSGDEAGPFESVGALLLRGARIGDALQIVRADLRGQVALIGAKVEGTVRFQHIRIEGGPRGGEAEDPPTCFDLAGARVGGPLEMADIQDLEGFVAAPPTGFYRLDGANVAGLTDNPWTAWPKAGLLRLDGFTYGRIEPSLHEIRLAWLERQFEPGQRGQGFNPQPYEHLAKVLREEGRDRDADKVARAKRDMYLRHATDGAWSKLPAALMGLLAHGYSRRIAVGWTIGWWVAGMAGIWLALVTGGAEFSRVHPEMRLRSDESVTLTWSRGVKGKDAARGLDVARADRPDVESFDIVGPGWDASGPRLSTTLSPTRARREEIGDRPYGCPGVVVPVYALELMLPIAELG